MSPPRCRFIATVSGSTSRFRGPTLGNVTTVARNLGFVVFGLSASRSGRDVFFSRVDSAINELMLVNDFR